MTAPRITYHATRDAWLAHRRGKIGGTTAAAILGVSPWATPWDVYAAEVLGAERRGPDAEIAARGLEFEPVALARWERSGRVPDGCCVDRSSGDEVITVERDDLPGWSASPDALVMGYGPLRIVGGVEVKTVSRSDLGRFWDDDQPEPAWIAQLDGRDVHPGDEGEHIPPAWLVQMLTYLEITGAEWWDLVILGPHIDQTTMLRVHRDEEAQARIVRSCSAWWERHVEGREPPPLDDSDACAAWARARWLETPRTVAVDLTDVDAHSVVERFAAARLDAKREAQSADGLRAAVFALATEHGASVLRTVRFEIKINKAGAVSAKERTP